MRIGIVVFAVLLAYPYIPGSRSFVANSLARFARIYRRAFERATGSGWAT